MAKFVKIGSKFINIDLISYIDINEMTIYLNSSDGITDVCYDYEEFSDLEEFENTIIEVLNNYDRSNQNFR